MVYTAQIQKIDTVIDAKETLTQPNADAQLPWSGPPTTHKSEIFQFQLFFSFKFFFNSLSLFHSILTLKTTLFYFIFFGLIRIHMLID